MEAKFTEMDAGDDDEIVELRRQIVSWLARNRLVDWQKNQLTGAKEKASRNRSLLGYDYAG